MSPTVLGRAGYDFDKLPFRGTHLDIPADIEGIPVTKIGRGAFMSGKFGELLNPLTSVTIPNSVTVIEVGAFEFNQLTNVIIPDGVTEIGDYAFRDNQLKSVTIPNDVKVIGMGVFNGNQLTSVNLPNSLTEIGDRAFNENQLTDVTIPNSVKVIGDYAFEKNQLTSVTIPNGVKVIRPGTFRENRLTSVVIPESVTEIYPEAFGNNPLQSVMVKSSALTPKKIEGNGVKLNVWAAFDSLSPAFIANGGRPGLYIKAGTQWSWNDTPLPNLVALFNSNIFTRIGIIGKEQQPIKHNWHKDLYLLPPGTYTIYGGYNKFIPSGDYVRTEEPISILWEDIYLYGGTNYRLDADEEGGQIKFSLKQE